MATRVSRLVQLDDGVCCAPLSAAPLAEREAVELAKVFAALADPVRLRLLSLVADGGEVCSCDLEVPLGQVAADDQPSHQGARRRRPAHRARSAGAG